MVRHFLYRTRGRSKAKDKTLKGKTSLDEARNLNIPKLERNKSSLPQEIYLRNPESKTDF